MHRHPQFGPVIEHDRRPRALDTLSVRPQHPRAALAPSASTMRGRTIVWRCSAHRATSGRRRSSFAPGDWCRRCLPLPDELEMLDRIGEIGAPAVDPWRGVRCCLSNCPAGADKGDGACQILLIARLYLPPPPPKNPIIKAACDGPSLRYGAGAANQ